MKEECKNDACGEGQVSAHSREPVSSSTHRRTQHGNILIALIVFAVIALLGVINSCRAGDPISAALAEALHDVAPGKIAFESPVKMKLDETKVVEVRIAKKLNQDLTEGLAKTGGHVEVEDIKVAPLMSATLNGSAFQITPLTNTDQVIADDTFTPWQWSVHPTDWGKQMLYLDVCVRLQLPNNKEERRCSPVYEREIAVEVAPMYAATHFIANNMVYTLGVLGSGASALFGGIVWIIRRAKKAKATILEP